jgi:hypothetical protein
MYDPLRRTREDRFYNNEPNEMLQLKNARSLTKLVSIQRREFFPRAKMQSWPCEFFTFVWWCLFNIPSVAASKTILSCDGLYLAESSIPNAGWGVFAGRIFQTGDVVVRRLAIVSSVSIALVHVVNLLKPVASSLYYFLSLVSRDFPVLPYP